MNARKIAIVALTIVLIGAVFTGAVSALSGKARSPFAIVFALASFGFFGTLALRLTPPAWETGNRASEFLFIGLAFILACAATAALRHWSGRRPTRFLVGGAVALVLIGDVISGWPWDAQLARPIRASAEGRTIVSPPLAMAEWARDRAREGRFAAGIADAGLLLDPGDREAIAGTSPDVEDIIDSEALEGWQLPLLRENDLRFVVADRRGTNGDTLRGYFFATPGSPTAELAPKSVISKFNNVTGAARVYTNGTMTVFDLEGRP
jgi:hypothetical protein